MGSLEHSFKEFADCLGFRGTSRPAYESLGCEFDKGLADAHRPQPDPSTGALFVDPEVSLKTAGFDMSVELYYNSRSQQSGQYGVNRSLNLNGFATSITSGHQVGVFRGNEQLVVYDEGSTVSGVTYFAPDSTTPSPTSLTYSGGAYTETFGDGTQIGYQQPPGTTENYYISLVTTPNKGTHTYTYGTGAAAGLLVSIQEPAGRLLSFSYIPGSSTSLLSEISD